MPDFLCQTCGRSFTVAQAALEKYPGWKPKQCMACKNGKVQAGAKVSTREEEIDTGVFTDGSASPNPGPGGWGAVYVKQNQIVAEVNGHEPNTTNNRMELTALIAGYKLVPPGERATVHTDSELCVNTITKWAPAWEKNGWRKKDGEIKNLDLVKTLYALAKSRPEITLKWVRGHVGTRWNEYADRLANRYRT